MDTIEYLKTSELVFRVQNYFGVQVKEDGKDKREFIVTNRFWHYLFLFGTELGDELFYSIFIPFWFWNIDGYVGRRVVLVWAMAMYTGQAIKDIIRWPRPGYPVIRLQNKWALEYGMPSTHAMVGISIPFSVLLFTLSRYQYNVALGLAFAVTLCTLICMSRLYLGMHTVLDILAGLALAISLMFVLVPSANYIDNYLLTNPTSPIMLLVTSILMIIYHPNSDKWTPTRGDTTMILSVSVGAHIGAWLNYQTGNMSPAELSPPYAIYWPSYYMIGCIILRTILGLALVLATRTIAKKLSYNFFCALLKQDVDDIRKSENTLENKHKNIVEIGCKYVTCWSIGFNILYSIPHIFRMLQIERPNFYTEI
ncbi:PREDICTED: sphingosine-1-phosphate phosphatase 1-like [Nicrophorus vespilloides]|uniref:Sphingosine-1-phosphate phosphatase 1-like n=1 Tax=Nicrophorus vespilloides TaxID=110193 RepID=A0ABM1N679_NICVS|nr:PREDICTED: sphingosine-1-phosphate phosphatase 1-like [Nicrophorus vespilloides]XP_017782330.1 PREDICTED: sphingosine-1-phosphate phosphatase 1-like [Nicrophorus vespilloides]XP_017782331.1 PREDICTED: sphingosine-1-phosphate phosphatase 1-like [Nicrophorus vespilloides]